MYSGALVQVGSRRRFLVASALSELSALKTCAFDFVIKPGEASRLPSFLKTDSQLCNFLRSRTVPNDVKGNFIRRPNSLLRCQFHRKLHGDPAKTQLRLGESVQKALIKHGIKNYDFVYAYDKAGALILSEAKSHGVKAILDQTIAPNDSMCDLLQEEANKLGIEYQGFSKSALAEIMDEQHRSWEAADTIVCGSDFVKDQLISRGVQAPISTLRPLLVNRSDALNSRVREWHGDRPLRLVTVGSAGLRKGAHVAIQSASSLLDSVDWRWIGGVDPAIKKMVPAHSSLTFEGILKGEALFEKLDWADAFVLPSLWEGSAFSIVEAAALGLPCLVTKSSGGWVDDGVTGIEIEKASSELLVGAIERILKSPQLVSEMSLATLEDQSSYNWNDHKKCLLEIIQIPRT